jgi:hypothetical protein
LEINSNYFGAIKNRQCNTNNAPPRRLGYAHVSFSTARTNARHSWQPAFSFLVNFFSAVVWISDGKRPQVTIDRKASSLKVDFIFPWSHLACGRSDRGTPRAHDLTGAVHYDTLVIRMMQTGLETRERFLPLLWGPLEHALGRSLERCVQPFCSPQLSENHGHGKAACCSDKGGVL